ncbi:cell wall hydrolase [Candidatus Uhrbacteria bacterium]|nr:cell wall hydrolase [Candidatus Uhrbacteria bacterium]
MTYSELRKKNIALTRSLDEIFDIRQSGFYAVTITASAKSWWQNTTSGRSFLQKDSLAVTRDGVDIPQRVTKRRLHSDDLWNGNILKGSALTMHAIFFLAKGEHTFSFVVHGKPFLESIRLSSLDDQKFEIQSLKAEKKDRTPWMTFVIGANASPSSILISARAGKGGRDDDDIRLTIDNEIQKNSDSKTHSDWYWCGKVLRGKDLAFQQEYRDAREHILELSADGAPFIDRIRWSFQKSKQPGGRIPSVDNPQWTGDFRDDPDQMILARAIFGEGRSLPETGRVAIGWVIRNRVDDVRWGDTYHDVILEEKQFSAFNAGDSNRRLVENPMLNAGEGNAWRDCFTIAGKVISGEIADPTGGANHYHAKKNDPEWARKMRKTLRVGNTSFYTDRAGTKIPAAPAFIAMILFTASVSVYAASSPRLDYSINPYGEFVHVRHYLGDNLVALYDGCGTECEAVRVFDEQTNEMRAQFVYGVGYVWSPDKKKVVAFHSHDSGMTIGDRYGNVLYGDSHLYTTEKYQLPIYAEWSPDGTTLAVITPTDIRSRVDFHLYETRGTYGRRISIPLRTSDRYLLEWVMADRIVRVNQILVEF